MKNVIIARPRDPDIESNGGGAYVMKAILHDWDNDRSIGDGDRSADAAHQLPNSQI
jgi:hypothetical protein